MKPLKYLFSIKEIAIIKNYKQAIVKHATTGEKICHCFIADTFFKRFKGLMLAPPLQKDEALLLLKTNSIHMFFMNYEIDVLFLSKENVIIDKIISMKKRRVSKMYKNCDKVLELKSRRLLDTSLEIGDTILIEEIDHG